MLLGRGDAVDSEAFALALLRSVARLTAAWGAVGKNWAKPALCERVIVEYCCFYHLTIPPTILSRVLETVAVTMRRRASDGDRFVWGGFARKLW